MTFFVLLADSDFRWFLDLEIWSVVVFGLLAALIYKLGVPPLVAALRGREASIEAQLRELSEAQREIEALRAEQEAKRRELRSQAYAMVESAKKDSVKIHQELVTRAREDVEKIKSRAVRDLDLLRRKAVSELANHATELSLKVASERLLNDLTEEDHGRLISSALDEMGSSARRTS
jgi:ATP synthase F0 subunit b